MNKTSNNFKVVCGTLAGFMIGGLTVVGANQAIQALQNTEIKVSLNGEVQTFKDETTGEIQYPITYHDRTYLPLRNVAQLAGLNVDYESNTNTALLTTNENEEINIEPIRNYYTFGKIEKIRTVNYVTINGKEYKIRGTIDEKTSNKLYFLIYMLGYISNGEENWYMRDATIDLEKVNESYKKMVVEQIENNTAILSNGEKIELNNIHNNYSNFVFVAYDNSNNIVRYEDSGSIKYPEFEVMKGDIILSKISTNLPLFAVLRNTEQNNFNEPFFKSSSNIINMKADINAEYILQDINIFLSRELNKDERFFIEFNDDNNIIEIEDFSILKDKVLISKDSILSSIKNSNTSLDGKNVMIVFGLKDKKGDILYSNKISTHFLYNSLRMDSNFNFTVVDDTIVDSDVIISFGRELSAEEEFTYSFSVSIAPGINSIFEIDAKLQDDGSYIFNYNDIKEKIYTYYIKNGYIEEKSGNTILLVNSNKNHSIDMNSVKFCIDARVVSKRSNTQLAHRILDNGIISISDLSRIK